MKRTYFVGMAMIAASMACGDLLGLGDDEADGPPSGIERASLDGGADDARFGDGASDGAPGVCETHALAFDGATDLQSALAAGGWSATTSGDGTMSLSNGRLLVGTNGGAAANVLTEAIISYEVRGRLVRATCSFDVELSTFAGSGTRFGELRLFGADWQDYRADVSFFADRFHAGVFATTKNDVAMGGSLGALGSGVSPGDRMAIELDFVADAPPTPGRYRANVGGIGITPVTLEPAVFDTTRAVVGIHASAGDDAGAFSASYGAISCTFCLAR